MPLANCIRSLTLLSLVVFGGAPHARAGFQVLSWDLDNFLLDSSGEHTVSDRDDIDVITNPLQTTAMAQIGNNIASATYDHSWIQDFATGDFNTEFTHEIRSPEVRTILDSKIFISPSEQLRVTIEGRLDYAHTPGDLDSFNFAATVRDMSTSIDLFRDQTFTGGLFFEPSSGTILINGEAILEPGTTYRLRHVLDSSNTGDLLPTGTMDATGFVNFSIRPIPEPTTALLLTFAVAASVVFRRRRPTVSRLQNHDAPSPPSL